MYHFPHRANRAPVAFLPMKLPCTTFPGPTISIPTGRCREIYVSGSRYRSTNQVVGTINQHTHIGSLQVHASGDVRADEVALDHVSRTN